MEQSLGNLLEQLTSSDNTTRSNAETSLETEWTTQRPDILFCGLAQFARSNTEIQIRSLAAVLLRRLALKTSSKSPEKNLWEDLTNETKWNTQQLLLESFAYEENHGARNQVCNAISEIALIAQNDGNSWPDLLPVLTRALQASSSPHRESALKIIESTPELIITEDISKIAELIINSVKDSDKNVQLAAIKAIGGLVNQDSPEIRDMLKFAFTQVFNSMLPWKEEYDSDSLTNAFTEISVAADVLPKLFTDMLPSILLFDISIINDTKFDDNTRQAALELLITLIEGIPARCRKEKGFASEVISSCLKMMTEVGSDQGDELNDWLNVDDLDSDESDSNHIAAEQALDRLARKLGGKTTLPPAFAYIPSMISSHNWAERHAALMAVSSIAEGCDKLMTAELDRVLDMILPLLSDQHPRVRWAAVNAVGQMSTDFAPEIEEKYHARILPNLIPVLDSPEPRVQAHAAAACVNFAEEADNEIIGPYLDMLLDRLLKLLQVDKRYVQEQAITTIATIADAAEKNFDNYYDSIMPLLMSVLRQADDKQYRTLRGKAIECATLIALAVGKERFAPNLQEMGQIFEKIQSEIKDDDDPVAGYLIAAWGRMCRLMGPDFVPLLGSIMPPLLNMAKAKPDFTIVEEDSDDQAAMKEEGWEFVPVHGQQIGIKTGILEDKCTAVEMLICYESELKEHFDPYADEVLRDVVLPGLKFYFHDGVRSAAAKNVPLLLNVRKLASKNNLEAISKMWEPISQKLLDVLKIEPSPELLADFFQAFYESIEVIGINYLTEEQVQKFMDATEAQLLEIGKRAEHRQLEAEDEELNTEEDDDENLSSEINKTLHVLAKHLKANYLKIWPRLVPFYQRCLDSKDENLIQWALCGFDDVIEFCSPESLHYESLIVNALAAGLQSQYANVRQAASYGFGVAAQHGGEGYAQICAAAMPTLFAFFSKADARDDENIYATENACIAIAKILRFNNSRVLEVATQTRNWIQTLPVTNDESDAPYAYTFLAELMENGSDATKGQPDKTFSSVAAVLEANILTDQTRDRLVTATKVFMSALPPDVVSRITGSIGAETQRAIAKYFN